MTGRPWRPSLLIALTCLVVRGGYCVATGAYERLNHSELDKIAIAVAAGEGFSNAFGQRDEPKTGPTAHYPPLFPSLLSLVYRLWGSDVKGEVAKYVFTTLLSCLVLGSLPFVARALGLPVRAGVLAGLFGAVVPIYLFTEVRGGELPFLALLLIVATVAFRRTMQQGALDARAAVGHGLLWGAILSTSPSPAPVLALWMLLLVLTRRPRASVVRFAAMMAVTMLVLLTPWTVRNYRVLGSPIWARSNLGLELQVSNNDLATPSGYENQSSPMYDLYHPNRGPEPRRRYRAIGEVAFHREKLREALTWIRDHPARFGRLTLARTWYFWVAPLRRPAQMVVLYALSGLALFGLWRLMRVERTLGLQIAGLWLGFSFIYCFVQFENRYRYPIVWSLLLLAAFGLTERTWWQQLGARSSYGSWARMFRRIPASMSRVSSALLRLATTSS